MLELHPVGESQDRRPAFISPVLKAAALYNLLWGAAVVIFPAALFQWAAVEPPRYPQIWQWVGMIVGVYGIGYWIAASDPLRHWPLVLVGLLGKVLGPIGFLFAAVHGDLPWAWGVTIIFNDLIWWAPFAAILYYAARHNSNTSIGRPHDLEDTTLIFPSQSGQTLAELSGDRPLMLVFLRHFGCTFCREALADLSRTRTEIEDLGFNIALVHMSHLEEADEMLRRFGLNNIQQFSDANCEIYRTFGLDRGSIMQLFGFTVWRRGAAATMRGHIVGRMAGDGFRMPGLFFLYRGEVYASYRHRTAADRPDYILLASECQQAIKREVAASK